jgi:hypothetical protein
MPLFNEFNWYFLYIFYNRMCNNQNCDLNNYNDIITK